MVATYERIQRECTICGETFIPKKGLDRTCGASCSKEHRRRMHNEANARHRAARPPRATICRTCREPFVRAAGSTAKRCAACQEEPAHQERIQEHRTVSAVVAEVRKEAKAASGKQPKYFTDDGGAFDFSRALEAEARKLEYAGQPRYVTREEMAERKAFFYSPKGGTE